MGQTCSCDTHLIDTSPSSAASLSAVVLSSDAESVFSFEESFPDEDEEPEWSEVDLNDAKAAANVCEMNGGTTGLSFVIFLHRNIPLNMAHATAGNPLVLISFSTASQTS